MVKLITSISSYLYNNSHLNVRLSRLSQKCLRPISFSGVRLWESVPPGWILLNQKNHVISKQSMQDATPGICFNSRAETGHLGTLFK